jgi:four helix bundle protein
MGERRNINRGFKKLIVWQDSINLFVLSTKIFKGYPFEMRKIIGNLLDSCHSISRNIAEGYCRKSINEYLNFLNISLGSCGEFHSSYLSLHKSEYLSEEDFQKLDELHYKVENQLLKLIESLQKKRNDRDWNDSFA